MAFWRRKKDEFVSLGLNRAADAAAPQPPSEPEPPVASPVEIPVVREIAPSPTAAAET
jgi:hypothetical protein